MDPILWIILALIVLHLFWDIIMDVWRSDRVSHWRRQFGRWRRQR